MQYRYTGPQTAMTLSDGRDVLLLTGSVVDLPEDADVTQTLIALGRLEAIQAKPSAKLKTADNKE